MRKICPIKNKLQTNRWLKCLEICKVVLDDEGYHILYLEQIENFIRRKQMYSPRISEELIPELYQLSKSRKIPMTKLVNKIVEDHLKKNVKKKQDREKIVVLGGG